MQNGQDRLPGTFTTLEFPITASVVLGALAVVAILLFIYYPKEREAEKFGIEAITLTAGALSAYYVGQGLKETVVQRERSLKDGQINVSCRLIERWNDPEMADMKDTFREIIASGKAHDAAYVEDELKDKQKRIVVVEILNYFEELALIANMGLADDATLKRYFLGALMSYHSTLAPWMKSHRASIGRPSMWTELDAMLGRWQAN